REPIRDETLREGFVQLGAVVENTAVPTTSSKPRYALSAPFARLFDPKLKGQLLLAAIQSWQSQHLSKGALARIALVRSGAAVGGKYVTVRFPNEESRRL
ncbi:MAG: hypothetical protein ACRD3W_11165, partial [Terriglobales bacterium]